MDALDRYLAENRDRFIAELRDLCAIPSETGNDIALDDAAKWCRQRLDAAKCATREFRVPGEPALVVGETGGGTRTLICVQHYDVQPAVPLELWATPPFEPAVRDGAVFARGVDDNKGHLLLRIQAVEAYRAVQGELPIRVRFLIEGEEEDGSGHLAELLAQDPTLTDGDGALKEGGAIDAAGRPQLLLGGKGIFYMELRVRSMARDAHSGGATHLPNAAWRLVQALGTFVDPKNGRILVDGFYDDVRKPTEAELAHVRSLPFEADVIKKIYQIDSFAWGRGDGDARVASVFEPTCNIAGIESGFTGEGSKTVIPSQAMAKIDFRLVPEQDPVRIGTCVRAHLDRHGFRDVEVIAREGTRPYRGRMDDPVVRAAQAAAEETFGKPALLVPSSGGTSPMWQVCGKRSLANVTLGMGHPNSGAHAPNENVLLDNYFKAIRATVAFYGRYATQQ
ncbi:MAG TPA: M20/M25/M40 family metallo-hydrolase [Candidatus Acidoferrales bacterium]|nr:M20/M25/M40 family metallo-hydrolase [Candidatus Acidoferrales bacterium]